MNTESDQLREDAAEHAEWFVRNRQWKTEAGAIRALARKHPEESPQECSAAFAEGVRLYHAAMAFINENADTLWERWNAVPPSNSKSAASIDVSDLADQLAQRVPGFPRTTYETMLAGLFFWWHVK